MQFLVHYSQGIFCRKDKTEGMYGEDERTVKEKFLILREVFEQI